MEVYKITDSKKLNFHSVQQYKKNLRVVKIPHGNPLVISAIYTRALKLVYQVRSSLAITW